MCASPSSPSAAGARRKDLAPARQDRTGLRFRIRVMQGEIIAVGPGKIDLLVAVGEHRSISAAAKALGMSYRRAWMLVDQMNRSLRAPVVSAIAGGAHGGGAALTEFGLHLIELYRAIEARARQACAQDIQRLLDMVADPS